MTRALSALLVASTGFVQANYPDAVELARRHYFWINKGPWSELDEHEAFMPGVPG